MKNILAFITFTVSVLMLAGCPKGPQKNTPAQQKMIRQNDSLDVIAKANQEKIAKMPVQELLTKLTTESNQKREPFNSSAFLELKKRKEVTGATILPTINTSDRSSLLGLLLLRKKDPEAYNNIDIKRRTAILIDALKTSENFNLWGLPHAYQEDAAKALIECGKPALADLKPLLRECKAINFYGDEEYYEFKKYKYRSCDYALFFYKSIQGEQFVMPEKPEERDQMIQQID